MAADSTPLNRIPPDVVALADYERLARETLDPAAWAYFSGGAADEITLAANRSAFDRLRIHPRVMAEMQGANTRVKLLGETLAHPILVAPTASHRLAHPEGEAATVLGAAAMDTPVVVSTEASVSLESLSGTVGARLWFQLYLQQDRRFTLDLVRRAEQAGYRAIVLTVDAPVNGVRNREQRAGFALPPGIEAMNLRGLSAPPPVATVFDPEYLAALPSWKDVETLRAATRLPLLLKGILSPGDARRACEAGADGIIVSNHGGRTLDTLPASIDALPRVVGAVAGKVPVLLDGGIRRGTDVFKALALGASAVLVGRPVLHGLAVAGATGVAHVLKILLTELEIAMLLAGRPTPGSIDRSALWTD